MWSHDDAEEQRLVAVVQRIQRDVFFEVARAALRRLVMTRATCSSCVEHVRRQQTAQAQRVALRFRESGALVEQRIAQQRHAAG